MSNLTEDEAALLTQVSLYGSDAYPVHRFRSGKWTWGPYRGINGPPTVYRTKREAVANFEAYLDVLRDRKAGRP